MSGGAGLVTDVDNKAGPSVMTVSRRCLVLGLPIASFAVADLSLAVVPDPAVLVGLLLPTVSFGSTGRTITFGPNQANKTIAAALMAASPGDVVQYPDTEPRGLVFNESVGVPDCVTLDLGGRLARGGTAAPIWSAGAILDGTGIADPTGYIQKMGGVVALGSLLIKGAEIRGFGVQQTTASGTAGIRAAGTAVGRVHVDNCNIHGNQNGIGPGGKETSIIVTNTWLHDNALDPTGLCHNIYAASTVMTLTIGPHVTSVETPLPHGGAGHAVKSRARKFTKLVGPCYLYSGDASCLDISDGSAMPCTIGPDVTFVKKTVDINNTVFGYCTESQVNGVSGIQCTGVNIVAACRLPNILNNGPARFDASCKFSGNILVATQPSLAVGMPKNIQ